MSWEPLPETVDTTRDLGSVLGRLHRTLGLARPDTVRTLEEHWPSIVGANLAEHCRVESVRHGELVLVVDDPAVAEHLRWSARDLIAAVNEMSGGDAVDELRIKVRRRPD